MKHLIAASLLLLGFATPADAAQRYLHAHPDCNVLWPCDGVVSSPRGLKIVKAMGGFGTAAKVYETREPRARHHRRAKVVDRPVPTPSPAKSAEKVVEVGSGVVRATTGAVAYVAKRATVAFQCIVDKLEAAGYRITEMGGYANHGHIQHSLHYSGLALDVNQMERNVTVPKMPSDEILIANSCGLVSGAQWRNADSGHFQLGGYNGHVVRVARHHRRHRVLMARRME